MNSSDINSFKVSILVVDDTPDNLRILSNILSRQGYLVRPVPDAMLAISSAQTAPPDLILLDIMMPKMSGYEVCEQLKANERTRDIPVIFISALDDVFDKVKAFSVGGVDYITKPFQFEEVLARVEIHLKLRDLQKRLEEQNLQLQQEILERKRAEAELTKANQELQRLATLDGLTQVANRRRFDEYLYIEWRRAFREHAPLALILCDIDYFKLYNDTYGHLSGDDCLKLVAQTLSQTVKRPADLVARYGGEEFTITLPNTTAQGAMHIAHTIQQAIYALKIAHTQSTVSEYVTLSLGIASIIPNQVDAPDRLIAAADIALYKAKEQGRNRIVLAPMDENGSISSSAREEQ